MTIQTGVSPEAVRGDARHRLFVEGADDKQFDPTVIHELLRENGLAQIQVSAMGACDNVRSAAQALVREHPFYYFIIDRDDQRAEVVERTWSDFPDPQTHNLLIWHKRELENYFIDPSYLTRSRYLKSNIDEAKIREKVRDACNHRVFLDAANLTLLHLNREIGRPLGASFSNPDEFVNQEDGARRVSSFETLAQRAESVTEQLTSQSVVEVYDQFVSEISGNTRPLQYGQGSWLELMSGKEIFRIVAGACFCVKDQDGRVLQGQPQYFAIARDLLRLPLQQQPSDFQQVVHLLRRRVRPG